MLDLEANQIEMYRYIGIEIYLCQPIRLDTRDASGLLDCEDFASHPSQSFRDLARLVKLASNCDDITRDKRMLAGLY